MFDVLLLLLILAVLHFYLLTYYNSAQYQEWFGSKRLLFLLLMWTLFGLFSGLEQTNAWGCVISPLDTIFSKNVLLSGICIGFLFLAYQSKSPGWQLVIGIGECLFWVAKLFLFKGGYVVGFAGSADFAVLVYDTLSLYARVFIIGLGVQKWGFRIWRIAAAAMVVMSVKVTFFATPATMAYEHQWEMEKVEEVRRLMSDNWKGTIVQVDGSSNTFKSEVLVSIDETSIAFTGTPGLADKYHLMLYGSENGRVLSAEDFNEFALLVTHISADSLGFALTNEDQYFELSLMRVRASIQESKS